INRNAECEINLLGNTWATPGQVALFHLDNGANDVVIGSFRARLGRLLWRKQKPIISPNQCAMETQQRRRLQRNSRRTQTCGFQKKRTDPDDQSVPAPQIGGTLASAIEYEKLMLHQDRLGNYCACSSGADQSKHSDDEMD